MKKILASVMAVMAVLSVSAYAYHLHQADAPRIRTASARTVHLKGNTIRVTLAETAAQRQQGLSGRAGLAADEGMLFIFQQEGNYAFWMKDMRFSIDILWIDSAGKIVYIAPSVSPDTYPTAFDPHMDALYVLELPAGYVSAHGIGVGDSVEI